MFTCVHIMLNKKFFLLFSFFVRRHRHVHVGSYETLAESAFGLAGFRFIGAFLNCLVFFL